ncbi:MAG: PAS domain S-box protein, partial [Campylobacterota bacterium]|nr:PAS domain S-box protein [Campylobacterota bacterium]
INDFVVSTDFNGNIVSSNKAVEKLLGYKADEIIGKNVAIFHCEEDIPNIVNNIAKLLTTGEFSEDLYIVKKNKQLLYVSISFSLLKDSGGEPIYIIATGSDITERKKVEEEIKYLNNNLQKEVQNQLEELRKKDEQLLQQSKLAQMGDMISMIAHQWRQPLNAISATGINLSLLSSMNILDNAKLQEISEFIQGQTQKMSSTIDTFINFVKPSRESKPFKLIQSIDAIIQIMGTQLVNHDIKVDIEIINEEISIAIDGHEDLLEQVIINLLSNSRDAFDELDKDN